VERLLDRIEKRLERRNDSMTNSGKRTRGLVGRTWVTRRGVKVDRISSAWFVRRFLDPKARLRLIDPKTQKVRSGEIGFDMAGGEFTHEGDRCTLETLIRSTGVEDGALRPIAEIVHDIDLKDGKFGRAETPGVQRVLEGIFIEPGDRARFERGFALLDDLYGSFGGERGPSRKPRTPRRRA
jgi:hypothetical protein